MSRAQEEGSRRMRVHVLQHVPFEGPAAIAPWFARRGATLAVTRLYAGDDLPRVDDFDVLVAMGGSMSVNDEDRHPWLIAEKALIREALARERPALGVCLGAQLMANALGARVYRNRVKEIGWFPVTAVPGGNARWSPPAECLAFHWHGETFDLPAGATTLARSEGCALQAFQVGPRAIGVQFHLEVTPQSVELLLEHCASDLTPGPYVQAAESLRAAPAAQYAGIHRVLDDLLTYLVD